MREEVHIQAVPGTLPDSRMEGADIRKRKYQKMIK
jgi:hypothetical protein